MQLCTPVPLPASFFEAKHDVFIKDQRTATTRRLSGSDQRHSSTGTKAKKAPRTKKITTKSFGAFCTNHTEQVQLAGDRRRSARRGRRRQAATLPGSEPAPSHIEEPQETPAAHEADEMGNAVPHRPGTNPALLGTELRCLLRSCVMWIYVNESFRRQGLMLVTVR